MKQFIKLQEYVNVQFNEYDDPLEAIREAYEEVYGSSSRRRRNQPQQIELEVSDILVNVGFISKIESFEHGSKITGNEFEDSFFVRNSVEEIERMIMGLR